MIGEEKCHIRKGSRKTASQAEQETPFKKALEANPRLAAAYFDRANAFYNKGEYDKVWDDINKARSLGYHVPKKFIKALRRVSGRER
jgi:tetratricopeptide (TPR) repeat protein